MSSTVASQLSEVLRKIDRPGSFCVSGSAPVVLPGLEVKGLGPIGLPLTTTQAEELKKHCEQAPYGKGEETLVDTNVRRVWQLKPEQFSLTNPDWETFLEQTVAQVQEGLGLEKQKLEAHLYDLLLYEPGGFFLPHRDGEKLDRMVATLVIVLPSSFTGGELVVRHEGQEQTIDFGSGDNTQFRTHFAAFYADCEHEIRPLREGHRLCLVYNLTLKKGKKGIAAPRSSEHIEKVTDVLRAWAQEKDAPRKLAITLEHQYTQEGLTWDALKGVDRARADVLLAAANQAGFQVHLALLTFHESGAAEGGGGYYGRRRRWYEDEEEEDDPSQYEMGEVYDSSLTAEHWSDSKGNRLPIGEMSLEEVEVLDSDALKEVEPEEEFEGYTGNAGMTLDRWYRHGALFLWPNSRHIEVLCRTGGRSASEALKLMVKEWKQASKKDARALKAQCVEFATAIIADWRENAYNYGYNQPAGPPPLFPALVQLDEPKLIKAYLGEVMTKDASADPGSSITKVCEKHGWGAFRPELEAVFSKTTTHTIERNIGLLEQICTAKAKKKEAWLELCRALAQSAVGALEELDKDKRTGDYRSRDVKRGEVLAGLARALLATGQEELLSRVVSHALARPEKYPLTEAHVSALTALGPWLGKNVKKASPALSHWIMSCREQLEALTAAVPQPPADFRRSADIACKCADCAELKKFLVDADAQVYRFRVAQDRRSHLADKIRQHHCDVDCKTEEKGRPYSLVCTKNTASYQARLKKYHQDQEHLATLRGIEAK